MGCHFHLHGGVGLPDPGLEPSCRIPRWATALPVISGFLRCPPSLALPQPHCLHLQPQVDASSTQQAERPITGLSVKPSDAFSCSGSGESSLWSSCCSLQLYICVGFFFGLPHKASSSSRTPQCFYPVSSTVPGTH